MPVYSFQCSNAECGVTSSRMLPILSYREIQHCADCNSECDLQLSDIEFVLKGDNWTGKNIKIKGQMRRKNRRLESKETAFKRDDPSMQISLAPNVNGERVDTWEDAKSLALSKGKDTTLYDNYIRKSKRGL